ncbi:MAG: lipopolysaccharide kinase [Microbacterium sp.]|nr:lipopolysaccharide kinase [Microbacterium sp.]
MAESLSITASSVDPALLALPWSTPLAEWPTSTIVFLPKGISRHLVRFASLSGRVVAIKETTEEMARREYDMLGNLHRLDAPCVERVAVIAGRTDANGKPLPAALVTAHLKFSLPYRALFTQVLRPDTATRLVDALAALLVRLHNVGFFWGDVSLSNTLFRRDAGAFAAYLVDAETGELHEAGLTAGQRAHDLDVARTNIAGEIMDLEAGGRLEGGVDALAIADGIVESYHSLWAALTDRESFGADESWRITERVQRLNALGFDIGEMSITTTDDGTRVAIQPKVVDAGHHQRRLLRLTGLDVEENQARRLLNDLDEFRARISRLGDDEEVVAHEWLTRVFEPVVMAIPYDLRAKLEPAEVYHQVLEHRWYLSQSRGGSVPLAEALGSYVDGVLRHRRDEATVMGPPTETMSLPVVTADMPAIDDEGDTVDWRDLV